ncbi:MAG: copper oxidase [Chloroflexi bacterium RBG_16_48_7]|nr:MAG: copper oxidase [Chloroflexi bacterium RBG_16_48_7]
MRNLKLSAVFILFTVMELAIFSGCDLDVPSTNPLSQQTPATKGVSTGENRNLLFIPPILDDKDPGQSEAKFELTVRKSSKEFFPGKKTETYGYNMDYLGPTIRVKNGEHVNVKVINTLTEETTVHWHGLRVAGEMDGGPQQMILSRNEWNPNFVISQPAATLWYHAHPIHKTGNQVYKGLSGLFIIDDENSKNLNLPDDYGVNDIPLIIQDKRFDSEGTMIYKTNMMDIMQGMLGNTILVNGIVNPVLEVGTIKTRFRILNGATARTFEFRLSDGSVFYQIASDGGLLESPVKMNTLRLGPGERAEVIIDFSKYSTGEVINLQSPGFKIIDFVITRKENDITTIPEKLSIVPRMEESRTIKTRAFDLMGMGLMVNINGKQMDMARIDETVNHGDTEIWIIRNVMAGMGPGMGMGGNIAHTFHYHGVQFQVLSRDGRKPPLNEQGWKDTVLVNPNETVKVISTFDHKGLFMYHCHILEHEDAGMMGQFEVK